MAHAFYPGKKIGGDVHFDAEETWLLHNEDESRGTSLLAVAVHELGHSLGLSHSSVEGAVMYPWYGGYDPEGDLPEDDKLGIQAIYGYWADRTDPTGDRPYIPRHRTTTRTTTTTTTTPAPTRPTRRHPHHKPHYPTKNHPNHDIDRCDIVYDAIAMIRTELFIFKGSVSSFYHQS